MGELLKRGDVVLWRSWAPDVWRRMTVASVSRMKEGEGRESAEEVESMPWSDVPRLAIVSFINGLWYYGSRIKRIVGP